MLCTFVVCALSYRGAMEDLQDGVFFGHALLRLGIDCNCAQLANRRSKRIVRSTFLEF